MSENQNTSYSELSTTYSPKDVEAKWYKTWEEGKYFKAKPGKAKKTFSIVMPPPNVTGRLHAGHALDITTQDALIRFKRMKGYETVFLPGSDHAGIATQSVVEKLVWEQDKKKRQDFSREEFLEKIWAWKKEYGDIIVSQQKAMGASADWDLSMFTMDPDANLAVRKVFVELYNQKLIYQSDYIVNWDTVLQSAISDAEVEHEEVKGNFYHIQYLVKGTNTKLEVATTRPETMLADTALAVNPNDERFKHFIGKTAIIPICNREIPIVGDEHVDIEKGTGCLKVTPGHDFNDFEIGKRHKLPIISMLNKDGTLNDIGGEFKGMHVKKARPAIVEKLKELEVLVDIKPHVHPVGHGERSKSIIEPMVSKQWFLKTDEMAKIAVEAVENETMKFYPKQWENTYFAWLREPKDWCISRQLWWGHQIPVFNCSDCVHQFASMEQAHTCSKCSSKNIKQDPDVLDTWFSSGLWPLTTLGWPIPEKMKERKFAEFYPTSVLVTGFDIIFFWVARMMMMGMKFHDAGKVPFEKVYIHAIVRDKLGRKMSKSLGNGIDPFDMIEQYGTDALRFTLAAGSGYNRTLNLDPDRIGGFRNFMNKIWNAYRFIQPNLKLATDKLPSADKLHHHERWILSELNETTKMMNESIEEFRFDDASNAIYSFVYDKYCSWFIELSKNILNGDNEAEKIQRASVLKYGFKKIVALLHPISPFITEELWANLKEPNDSLLITQDYPEFDPSLEFKKDQDEMNKFIDVVTTIRNIRASVNAKPKDEADVLLFTDDKDLAHYFSTLTAGFKDLARVKTLSIHSKADNRPEKCAFLATTHTEVFMKLEGVIDIGEQVAKITKEIEKTKIEYDKLQKKLSTPSFADNAPKEVVQEVKEKAQGFLEKITALEQNLKNFK